MKLLFTMLVLYFGALNAQKYSIETNKWKLYGALDTIHINSINTKSNCAIFKFDTNKNTWLAYSKSMGKQEFNSISKMDGFFLHSITSEDCTIDTSKSNTQETSTKSTQNDTLNNMISFFDKGSVTVSKESVECTLSGGTKSMCAKITVKNPKAKHQVGPWCPRNINDGDDKGGIWLDSNKVHNVDGNFIKNLATFYKDSIWSLFDKDTGKINVTNTKEACLGAAKPDVEAQYQNHCVECLTSYFEDSINITYLIPIKPVIAKQTIQGANSGFGLSSSGIKYDASAPVHAILGAHTIAPFDDCGGHVNPHAGYHYHAVTDCVEEETKDDDHKMIGYALDGFSMYARLSNGAEPKDLDACRGHNSDTLGYHYHANNAGSNKILGCFKAESGCEIVGDTYKCDNQRGTRPPPPERR